MIFNISGRKPNPKTDEELIAEFNSTGDLDLLGKLYTTYMPLVYGVCLKYLKDRDESKDAVMQIFEKIITEIPKQSIGNFRGWLYVVTKNFCLMHLRSMKSQNEKLTEWAADPVVFMENSSGLHPIDEDGEEMEKDLSDCIKRLKDEQAECIRLFYYENRCYSEIATLLKIDEKKVKSHLQNAKRNLKLCLEEKHAGQE
ncbi:MAG: sigma-70 family RNA polymerase sigma factor [Bacteroidales bacterium]|nr:sigma-70 family RNA polymerase sigma factor [Bacteroidales bacterium]